MLTGFLHLYFLSLLAFFMYYKSFADFKALKKNLLNLKTTKAHELKLQQCSQLLATKKNIHAASKLLVEAKILELKTQKLSLAELNSLIDDKLMYFSCDKKTNLDIFSYTYKENIYNSSDDIPNWVVGYSK